MSGLKFKILLVAVMFILVLFEQAFAPTFEDNYKIASATEKITLLKEYTDKIKLVVVTEAILQEYNGNLHITAFLSSSLKKSSELFAVIEYVADDILGNQYPKLLEQLLKSLEVYRIGSGDYFTTYYLQDIRRVLSKLVHAVDNEGCVNQLSEYITKNPTLYVEGSAKWLVALKTPAGVLRNAILESIPAERIAVSLPNLENMKTMVASITGTREIAYEIAESQYKMKTLEDALANLKEARKSGKSGAVTSRLSIDIINDSIRRLEAAKIRLGITLRALEVRQARIAK